MAGNLSRALFLMPLLLLGGCATLPEGLDVPVQPVSVAQAQAPGDAVLGRTVRWGGTIAAVENLSDETQVELVARRLDAEGRPLLGDGSEGRFLARIHGFLDPAIYARDRALTVVGTLERPVTGKVGEYPYRFPVVRVDAHKLWRPLPAVRYVEPYPYAYPYAWRDPWYPWRRWPGDPFWW